jgi:hypothetical protein
MKILLVDWCLKHSIPVTTAYRWIAQDSFPTSKQHGMRWIEEDTPVPIIPKGRPVTKNLPGYLVVQPDKSSDTEQPWNPLAFAGVPGEVVVPATPPEVVEEKVASKRGRPKGSKNKVVEKPLAQYADQYDDPEVKKRIQAAAKKLEEFENIRILDLLTKQCTPEVTEPSEKVVTDTVVPKRGRPKGSKNKSR